MKFYLKPILSVVVVALLLGYSGCKPKGGDDPDPKDAQLAKLKGTWKVSDGDDVKLDEVSVKSDYTNFTLSLTGNPGETSYGYTTSNRPSLSPWPSSGTWEFGSDIETTVIRDKGVTNKQVEIGYSVTDTKLELEFTYTGSGESGKVTGQWFMTLTKQ